MKYRGVATRAALVGAGIGVALFAAGSLILYEAGGALAAAGGLVATFAVALAAGVWAGAPGATGDRAPTPRWLFAGIALAVAGAFATLWDLLGGGARFGAGGRAIALLILVGLPVYAAGFLLPALVAWERSAIDEDEEPEEGPAPLGVAGSAALAVLLGIGVGAALSGLLLLPRLAPGPLLLAMGAILVLPLFFPRVDAPGTGERTLHETETPFNVLRITEIVYPEGRQP
ncbi:MAG TPA: hypothetical protein VE913_11945, partial [Longimicrobium sp.]|nr:hypothetical protein [Longimicrobium sp.]